MTVLFNIPVRFQLDMVSNITLILRSTWTLTSKPTIRKTKHVIRSASGDIIQLIGELSCNVCFNVKNFIVWIVWILIYLTALKKLIFLIPPSQLGFTYNRLLLLQKVGKKSQIHLKPNSAVFSGMTLGAVPKSMIV